jgi:hypothetical protein
VCRRVIKLIISFVWCGSHPNKNLTPFRITVRRDRYAYAYAKQAVLGMKDNLDDWVDQLGNGGGSSEQTRRQQALAENMQELWGDACVWGDE